MSRSPGSPPTALDSPFNPARRHLRLVDEAEIPFAPPTTEEILDTEARSVGAQRQFWTLIAMHAFPMLAIGTTIMSVAACAEGARITSMVMGVATATLLIARSLAQRTLRAQARRVVNARS